MLAIVDALVQLLFRILEGLLQFFRILIPLLGKLFFALSPFILITYVASVFGGAYSAIGAGVITVGLMVVGLAYAYRHNITGTRISTSVIIAVLAVNAVLVAAVVVRRRWLGNEGIRSKPTSTGPTEGGEKSRQTLLLELLNQSMDSDNFSELTRAIQELQEMNSTAAAPDLGQRYSEILSQSLLQLRPAK